MARGRSNGNGQTKFAYKTSATQVRFLKALLTLIAAALTATAASLWIGPDGSRALQPRAAEAQARTITVPKDWGKAVGFIAGHVYLEAAAGTIRLVNIGGGGTPIGSLALVIGRQ